MKPHTARLSLPISMLILALAALVPWAAVSYLGFVLNPIVVLGGSLDDAYERLGYANRGYVISSMVVGAAAVFTIVVVAWIRVRAHSRSAREQPYSAWRTVRLACVLYFLGFGIAAFPAVMFSVHLGVVEPMMYESPTQLLGPALTPLLAISPWVAAIAAIIMFAVDRSVRGGTPPWAAHPRRRVSS